MQLHKHPLFLHCHQGTLIACYAVGGGNYVAFSSYIWVPPLTDRGPPIFLYNVLYYVCLSVMGETKP